VIGKNIEVSQLEALFLISLHSDENMTGSAVARKIVEDLGEEWTPSSGAIYKTLDKLRNNGFIKDTTPKNLDDKRVRTYSLTKKGREIVPKVASRVQKIVVFVEDCCPDGCCSVDSSLNLEKKRE
jgi:DNA-binding PadR family transcriptional regulator